MTRPPLLPLTGFLALLVTVPTVAQAQEPAPLPLDAAIREALIQRPLLTGDLERVEAAKARTEQARAALRPRIEGQFSASEGLPGAPQVFIGGLAGTPFKRYVGGSVTLVQTLLDFGRARASIRSRQADVAAAEQVLQADRNRVALEVQQAYFQALLAQRQVRINQQLLEQRKQVLEQVRVFQQNGLVSRVDVDLAGVAVSQAELALVQSRNAVTNGYAALGASVGRILPESQPLTDILPAAANGLPAEPASIPNLASAIELALKSRPEIQQVQSQAAAAEGLADAAAAAKRPLLNFLGSVGRVNPGPLIEENNKPYAVAVVLTIPISTGGLLEAQGREAKRTAAATRAGGEELANQLRQQVTAATAAVTAADESARLAIAQQTLAQDALSLATQRYQSQLGSIVEVTQAQLLFAQAQNDLVRARYDQALSRAALDFAIGKRYAAEPVAGSTTRKP